MYTPSVDVYNTHAVGTVVDTNDPQGRGRVRAYCPDYGDIPGAAIETIPWCRYVSSFGGMVTSDTMGRGPTDKKTDGSVAYGMWSVPKVGSEVLLICINGDSSRRAYIGCLMPDNAEHTMPHGRFLDGDGPFSSTEKPIEPLYSNLKKAFGDDHNKHEFKTRGADSSVTGLTQNDIDKKLTTSKKKDSNTGYKKSRMHPDKKSDITDVTFDPQIYSMTSPGFHSISMDDSLDNGRIRIRSACGHSIIMDDTNERIYINTAEGNSWIELDQDGTIDIYSSKSVSVNSDTDISFHAKESIRLDSKNIHLTASEDIRVTATNSVDFKSKFVCLNVKEKYMLKTKGCDIKSKGYSSTSETTNILSTKATAVSGQAVAMTGKVTVSMSAPVVLSSTPVRIYDVKGPMAKLTADPQPEKASQGIQASIKKAPGPDKGHMMKSMPSADLGTALTSMPTQDARDAVMSVDNEDMSAVVDNIPEQDLQQLITKLPSEASHKILTSMDSTEVFDTFSKMPSNEVSDVMSNMNSDHAGELLDKLNNDNVASPFAMMSSDKVGEVLKSLTPDQISTHLGNLPENGINNMDIDDISEIIHKHPNPEDVVSFIPPDILGKSLGGTSADKAAEVMFYVPDSLKPDVLAHVPTSKLSSMPSDTIKMRPPSQLLPLDELQNSLPQSEKSWFPESKLSPTDLGHRFRTMPKTSMESIMQNITGSALNSIIPSMHGGDVGYMMSRMSNPSNIMSMLDPGARNGIMTSMPGANVSSMFNNMSPKELSGLFDTLDCAGIGNMLHSMPGGDIIHSLRSYSHALGCLGGLDGLGGTKGRQIGMDQIPDVRDLMQNALGNVPELSHALDNIIGQMPGANSILRQIQGGLSSLPVSLSIPPMKIPGIMKALGLPRNPMSSVTGILGDMGSFKGNIPSLGMLGNMKGMLGSVTGMMGEMPNLQQLSNMAGGLGRGRLNNMDGVGEILDCIKGPQLGHVLNNIPPGDHKNVMNSIPDSNMKNMLDGIPKDQLGNMMYNMPKDQVNEMTEKLSESEMNSMLNDLPDHASTDMVAKKDGAKAAQPGEAIEASVAKRIPKHEPWARTESSSDHDKTPKHSYDDPDVGKNGNKRNEYWKR